MIKRRLSVIGLSASVALSAPVLAQADAALRSQQQLVAHLGAQLDEHRTNTERLRAAISSGQPLELARDPRQLLRQSEQQLHAQQRWLDQVQATPALALPEQLVTMRLSCRRGSCNEALATSFVEDALVAYGALVLPPLKRRWPAMDAWDQEAVVYLAGRFVPAVCPLEWLDQALEREPYRLRAAALRVIQNNCESAAFWPRLDALLVRETDPALTLNLLDFVPPDAPQSPAYRLRLLRLVQTGQIELSAAFGRICALPAPPLTLTAASIDTAFWLRAFLEHPEWQMCLVDAVVLKLSDSASLEPLLPIFQAAAAQQFGFNDQSGLSARVRAESNWNTRPGTSAAVLALFRAQLSDAAIARWRAKSTLSLGDQLLLAQWQGDDPSWQLGNALLLDLKITDASGNDVSLLQTPISLGQLFSFDATSRIPAHQAISHQGSIYFDAEKLQFRLVDFRVGLKPAAVSFSAEIPISGRFATNLIVAERPYRWQLRIIERSVR